MAFFAVRIAPGEGVRAGWLSKCEAAGTRVLSGDWDIGEDQQRQEGLPDAVAALEATIAADNALVSDEVITP